MTRRDTTENENGFWGTYPPSPPVCDAIFEGETEMRRSMIKQFFRNLFSIPFQVAMLVNVLTVVIIIVLVAPASQVTGAAVVVGAEERVQITGETGITKEVLASVNTGVTGVTIDRRLAKALNLDLTHAERVTVQTSAGKEERPVVKIVVELADRRRVVNASVADRSATSTPVLVGSSVLDGLVVTVDQTQLSSPGSGQPASTLDSLIANSAYGIAPVSLIVLFPVAAVIVVLIRTVIGIMTLGTFAPILIAFSMLQIGIIPSLMIFGIAIGVGLVTEPLILRRYNVSRTARLGVLIGMITVVLLVIEWLAKVTISADALAAVLPLVITSVIIERVYESWNVEGFGAALQALGLTLAVSLILVLIMLAPIVRYLADAIPLPLALICVVWLWLLGTYRGLRLVEVVRFRLASRVEQVA